MNSSNILVNETANNTRFFQTVATLKSLNRFQKIKLDIMGFESDIFSMLYFNYELPEQISNTTNFLIGRSIKYMYNIINNVKLYFNDILIEDLNTEAIKKRLNVLEKSYDIKFLNIKNSNNYNTLIQRELITFPLPFSIFMNDRKINASSLNNIDVLLFIEYNTIDHIYDYNSISNKSINDIDMTKIEITIEFLKKNEAVSNYPIRDEYYLINNRNMKPNIEYEINFNNGDVSKILLDINLFSNNRSYYGYNIYNAICNYLNSYIRNYRLNTASPIINLSTGILYNNKFTNDLNIRIVDSFTYEIKRNTYTVLLVCNKDWKSLDEDLFLDLANIINMNFYELNFFLFQKIYIGILNDEFCDNVIIDPNIVIDGNEKIVGALFKSKNKKKAILGVIDYEINFDVTNEQTVYLLASIPVRTHHNEFTTGNYFNKSANKFNNCWDLDKKYKIKINLSDIGLKLTNVKYKFNKSLLNLFSNENDENFFINFCGDNNGYVRFTNRDMLSFRLDDTDFFVRNFEFNITNFLIYNDLDVSLNLFQENKRLLVFENNTVIISDSSSVNRSLNVKKKRVN